MNLDSESLEAKWEQVGEETSKNGIKLLRIDSLCKPELFVGMNSQDQRCLVMFVPQTHKLSKVTTEREKVVVSYQQVTNSIVITLKDLEYSEIFNDLILSLFGKIHILVEVDRYLPLFQTTLYQWLDFFSLPSRTRMSLFEIQGLWGELWVLREILKTNQESDVNYLLSSWKGPFGNTNDFYLNDINYEVKTKTTDRNIVTINSLHQLDGEIGKDLELIILTVEDDLKDGVALSSLFGELKTSIIQRFGNIEVLLQALGAIQLDAVRLSEYDNFRFTVREVQRYDCLIDDFPRLTPENTHDAITSLKYTINTRLLSNFLIKKEGF